MRAQGNQASRLSERGTAAARGVVRGIAARLITVLASLLACAGCAAEVDRTIRERTATAAKRFAVARARTCKRIR
jgi:hypothetical protein